MKKIKEGMESWARGVVMSDGVWHTRGHFSKNGSFLVKKYITGGLLHPKFVAVRTLVVFTFHPSGFVRTCIQF